MLDSLVPDYQWVSSNSSLQQVCEACSHLGWVAIDTEFVRFNTYYPRTGLIQLAAGGRYFLIDPLAVTDTRPLVNLLNDSRVVKIMHACSEDLELFRCYLGVLPQPLFDTQIAAALLGYGLSTGYKNLVEQLYGITLPKEQQRSNWCKRPLTQAQQDYAILDVVYLGDIYQQQLTALEEKGRLAWLNEECQSLLEKQSTEMAPEQQYLRIKGIGNLNGQQLYVVKTLAEWRERQVKKRNIPRGFMLKDNVVIELSRKQPGTLAQLAEIEDLHPKTLRREGKTILALIRQAVDDGVVLAVDDNVLPSSAKPQLRKMQQLVAERAGEVDIPAEMIMNKKMLANILMDFRKNGRVNREHLQNWKKELVLDQLTVLLNSFEVAS